MDITKVEKKVVRELTSAIERHFSSLSHELYHAYAEQSEERVEAMRQQNEILQETFTTIASMYGVVFTKGFDIETIEESTSELKKHMDDLAKSSKPLKRVFAFSIGDDYGHTRSYIVTNKNKDFIDCIFDRDADGDYEHLYKSDNKIILGLQIKSKSSFDTIQKLDSDELLDQIGIFFDDLIKDETVSVEMFSEYLESLLDTSRHSGCSATWATL